MYELEDTFRAGEILQPVFAEFAQGELLAELVECEVARRGRHEHLAAVGDVAQPCRADDGHAHVVRVVA